MEKNKKKKILCKLILDVIYSLSFSGCFQYEISADLTERKILTQRMILKNQVNIYGIDESLHVSSSFCIAGSNYRPLLQFVFQQHEAVPSACIIVHKRILFLSLPGVHLALTYQTQQLLECTFN